MITKEQKELLERIRRYREDMVRAGMQPVRVVLGKEELKLLGITSFSRPYPTVWGLEVCPSDEPHCCKVTE